MQRAVVVLGLEAQVALHVDLDFGERAVEVLAQRGDVVLDQVELEVGLWGAGGATIKEQSARRAWRTTKFGMP